MSANALVRIPFEKQHTCVACGCVFRYPMERVVGGAGMMAGFNMDKQLRLEEQDLRSQPQKVVERHPCPCCGLIQPGMKRWARIGHAGAFLFGTLSMLALFGISQEEMSPVLPWAGVVIFAAVAVAHAVAAYYDPDRDRSANLIRAKQELAAGNLKLVRPGTPGEADRAPAHVTAWHILALLLVVPAPLAFFYPLSYLDKNPLPVNPGLVPQVVNPGDQVRHLIAGIGAQGLGPWYGQTTVRVLNAKEVGAPETLPASGGDKPWDKKVKVTTFGGPGPLKNAPLTALIHFTLPPDQALAGKTLRLEVTIHMTYAVLQGSAAFRDETATVSTTLSVRLADAEYTQRLREAFLIGLGGAALSSLGGLILTLLAWPPEMKAAPGEEVVFSEPAARRDL
jgi:hypothetical protein